VRNHFRYLKVLSHFDPRVKVVKAARKWLGTRGISSGLTESGAPAATAPEAPVGNGVSVVGDLDSNGVNGVNGHTYIQTEDVDHLDDPTGLLVAPSRYRISGGISMQVGCGAKVNLLSCRAG
jgi:hypothetical protein